MERAHGGLEGGYHFSGQMDWGSGIFMILFFLHFSSEGEGCRDVVVFEMMEERLPVY